MYFNKKSKIKKSGSWLHRAIPFFVRTPPLWKVSDFRPDFFPFSIMEGYGFLIKIAIPSIPYTGFCVCEGYGWPWISQQICVIIHTLVGYEQCIFCSCLDYFVRSDLYLWKMLDFSIIMSSIGKSMDFMFQTWIPSIGVWQMLEIQLDFPMIGSSIGKSMDFFPKTEHHP